ncbi:MAG TPA: metalloprotease, partial [Maribacter sp.]|nr:metalloprotease [Maribacter sp.]
NWFFNDYVSTDRKIDFKIKKVKKDADSLHITLKNKEGTNVPISVFGLKKDSVVSEYWFKDIELEETFSIPNNQEDRLVLNYDQKIPEFNQRDNWKSLKGFLSSNKKLKFTFFKDAENPYYNQVFYVPILNFNVYDGWVPGMRLYNKTLLERPFVYDFAPSYSFREKAFVGYGKFNYRKYLSKSGLYVANYGIGASTSHFNENSRYTSITPSLSFGFRPADLLSNKREFLSFRYVNILRDFDPSLQNLANDPENPDYSVFNARYINRDNGILDYKSWFLDFQLAGNFSKLSFEYEYRKLFENNRQLNLRFFAGKFLSNKTQTDFFSFALDRPTDYLFDYGYLGRSEDSGIYSQQIIIAEGGFKSFLDQRYRFSNDWMATMNGSFNLWKWIELYGDAGLVKNRDFDGKFVYDSGVRLNLVTDYFELYLPVYSNNGWEVSQPNYGEKIRFIITVSPKTLTGLFTRKWF